MQGESRAHLTKLIAGKRLNGSISRLKIDGPVPHLGGPTFGKGRCRRPYRRAGKPNDPTSVLIHDDENPVSAQHGRFAAKEVRAPETVLHLTEEC